MHFICHETSQDHSIEVPCIFTGESSLQHVTILKSLVTIDILIVEEKNASSKSWFLYVRTATEKIELTA